ncbi:MAG TPA: hypothetical protein VIU12_07120 [Chryseolinea sp.]
MTTTPNAMDPIAENKNRPAKKGASNLPRLKRSAFFFLLFAISLSCSFSSKQNAEANAAGGDTGTVPVSGKVGFPQTGQIVIQ